MTAPHPLPIHGVPRRDFAPSAIFEELVNLCLPDPATRPDQLETWANGWTVLYWPDDTAVAIPTDRLRGPGYCRVEIRNQGGPLLPILTPDLWMIGVILPLRVEQFDALWFARPRAEATA